MVVVLSRWKVRNNGLLVVSLIVHEHLLDGSQYSVLRT